MTRAVVLATLFAAVLAGLTPADALMQNANPRFGKWRLKSDASPPASNVMTYEPVGTNGMKVVIDAVNREGIATRWWYTTTFDGADSPVTGNPAQDSATVTVIDDRVNRIVNKKDGKITQVLTNVLSPDGSTIGIIYMRVDGQGRTTSVSFATYERMK